MKNLFFACVCIAIVVFVTHLFFNSFFKAMPVEQILWHIKNPHFFKGAAIESFIQPHYLAMLVFYLGIACIIFFGKTRLANFFLKIFFNKNPHDAERFQYGVQKIFNSLQIAAGCAAIVYLLSFIPWLYDIYNFYFMGGGNSHDFIADNYVAPPEYDAITFPYGKNNLVCVLAESMENTFGSKYQQKSYITQLEKLRSDNQGNDNFVEVHGAGWTIGAETAWFFGLPIKLPVGVHENGLKTSADFLPGAVSIFDILHMHGYKCVMISGADKRFAGTDKLFAGHGNFEIYDRAYLSEHGYSLAKHGGIPEWGYNDTFVLNFALETYKTLLESGEPFVLFIKTVDTHFPDGYCPEGEKKYGDIRDAIGYLDREIASFAQKISSIKTGENKLALCVIGDHYYMGKARFLEGLGERRIYNMFFSKNIPDISANKLSAPVCAMDIAPTLLQMAGARWNNDKFGLGTSLFSRESGIVEKFGLEKLNQGLARPSRFYSKLYYNDIQ